METIGERAFSKAEVELSKHKAEIKAEIKAEMASLTKEITNIIKETLDIVKSKG